MSIATLDQYIASVKQRVPLIKTASRTAVALIPFSVFDLAGDPGAGVLSGGATTVSGVVPTDATAGCPVINFSTGTGYLTKIEYASTVISRIHVYDMLWKGGAYAFNSAVTLSAQPTISGRCPDYAGGASFGNGNEIWLETVTAFTGSQTITVTYTNSAGTTGRTTGAIATGVAPTVGRMLMLPLQAGDSGVQKIESVTSTVSTVGTFNVLIMRPLTTDLRVRIANEGGVYDMLSTGMPIVYSDSALRLIIQADSTATGLPHCILEIASA